MERTQQEKKTLALQLLRERTEPERKRLNHIDPRLTQYYDGLIEHEEIHNLYEYLSALQVLRKFRTYKFSLKRVRHFIEFIEGQWRERKDGAWEYVEGSKGIQFSGLNGYTHYMQQPFQVFASVGLWGFFHWVDTGARRGDRVPGITERFSSDGRIMDYRRLCTEIILYMTRKSGKTQYNAGVQAYQFYYGDVNHEGYCAANSQDQSKVLFDTVKGILRQTDPNEELIRFTAKEINWKPGKGRTALIRACSAGGKKKDGWFAGTVSRDEYGSAEYTNDHCDMKDLVDVLDSSMGPRREPLDITTTTAGYATNGPFINQLAIVKAQLEKELDLPADCTEPQPWDYLHVLILEPDEWEQKDEERLLTDKRIWRKSNPMIGISVQPSFYEQQAKKALTNPDDRKEFLTKLCNVYQMATVTEWISPEQVRALQTDMRIDDCTVEKGWDVYAAFDFSHGDDFDAVTFLAYNIYTHEYFADCDAWVNREAFNKSPFRPLYEKWKRDGWLHVSGENVVEPEATIARVMELDEKHINFKAFGYDAYQSKEPILLLNEWLINEVGISKPETIVVSVSQTFANYNAAVQKIDYCIDGVVPLHFSRSPLWTWEFGNCVLAVDPRMENKKMVKRSANLKVDNVQCLASCFNLEEKFCI